MENSYAMNLVKKSSLKPEDILMMSKDCVRIATRLGVENEPRYANSISLVKDFIFCSKFAMLETA